MQLETYDEAAEVGRSARYGPGLSHGQEGIRLRPDQQHERMSAADAGGPICAGQGDLETAATYLAGRQQ